MCVQAKDLALVCGFPASEAEFRDNTVDPFSHRAAAAWHREWCAWADTHHLPVPTAAHVWETLNDPKTGPLWITRRFLQEARDKGARVVDGATSTDLFAASSSRRVIVIVSHYARGIGMEMRDRFVDADEYRHTLKPGTVDEIDLTLCESGGELREAMRESMGPEVRIISARHRIPISLWAAVHLLAVRLLPAPTFFEAFAEAWHRVVRGPWEFAGDSARTECLSANLPGGSA